MASLTNLLRIFLFIITLGFTVYLMGVDYSIYLVIVSRNRKISDFLAISAMGKYMEKS